MKKDQKLVKLTKVELKKVVAAAAGSHGGLAVGQLFYGNRMIVR